MASSLLSPTRSATVDLYPLEPAIQELLTLKSFSEDKFDIKDFIGAISEKLITQSKEDPGPFDPKPFIRTFESVVDNLISLRKDVQRKTEQQEQSCKTAEKEYSKKLADLNRGFESVGRSFNGMESKITEVGRSAIRIGEQLESIHVARQRAQAAHDLVYYWNQFSRGDTSKLEALRKEGREGRQQVAILLRRLNAVAKELDIKGAEKTRVEIDKYCEKFEKDMLRMFDKSYRKGDPKVMKHCAQTLLEFNGGVSCVQIYVNQHDFFISKSRVNDTTSIEESQLWEILPNPDASLPKKELGLEALLNDIRVTVGQEAQIIQAVFPNPPLVMQVFLQRVFEQSIQQHVEQLMEKAGNISDLAFLRVLQLAHVQVSKLSEDLKVFDLSATSTTRSTEGMSATTALDLLDSREGRGMGVALPIGIMLENAMEELFVRYIEGTKYLERESKSLGELYSSYLSRFTKYHAMVTKAKNTGGLLDRMVDRIAAASGNSLTSSSATSSATAAFAKLSGMASSMKLGQYPTSPLPSAPSPTPGQQPESRNGAGSGVRDSVSEADGLLSLDTAEKILKWHAEAVGRCVEMSPSSDVAKNAFALSRVLAEALGTSYMEVALERASSAQFRIDTRDNKLDPDVSAFSVIHGVALICHLWQQYVSIALMPLASSSVTVRREMMVFNTQTISRIEATANLVEQKLLDSVVSYLSTQLLKQKKNDFKPKNDDLSFARVNTEPCISCCDMLEKVRDAAKESLSGQNLESFLTEIGVTFHSMLLDHLKKFPVNATGGLMLAKDLKSYQDTIATFGMPALDERFEFIRQLGNVFLVRPEILKSYVTEDYLGRIDSRLLRPYLAQRSDWGEFRYDDAVAVGADAAPEPVGNVVEDGEVRGLRERLGMGKIREMMKELEGLRAHGLSSGSGAGTSQQGGSGGYSFSSFSLPNVYS
ncbi:Exocyst complex component 5 [Tulasnella sp. 403]|nr:Exocyst complex component 5 [Tulasnella sp. 403]